MKVLQYCIVMVVSVTTGALYSMEYSIGDLAEKDMMSGHNATMLSDNELCPHDGDCAYESDSSEEPREIQEPSLKKQRIDTGNQVGKLAPKISMQKQLTDLASSYWTRFKAAAHLNTVKNTVQNIDRQTIKDHAPKAGAVALVAAIVYQLINSAT